MPLWKTVQPRGLHTLFLPKYAQNRVLPAGLHSFAKPLKRPQGLNLQKTRARLTAGRVEELTIFIFFRLVKNLQMCAHIT